MDKKRNASTLDSASLSAAVVSTRGRPAKRQKLESDKPTRLMPRREVAGQAQNRVVLPVVSPSALPTRTKRPTVRATPADPSTSATGS